MKVIHGDLLSVERGIIVHGCNARGVMGSGIARAIRQKWPRAYDAYMRTHQKHGLELGTCIAVAVNDDKSLYVINAITQKNYGHDRAVRYVDYTAVRQCFGKIHDFAKPLNLPIYYPLIGAGLANGSWDIISTIIADALDDLDHSLWVLPE